MKRNISKREIPCLCGNTFIVEPPEEIDLDEQPLYLDTILDGTFMTFACSICGKQHTPEFPVTVLWPSRNLVLEVLPQAERASFYRRKKLINVKKRAHPRWGAPPPKAGGYAPPRLERSLSQAWKAAFPKPGEALSPTAGLTLIRNAGTAETLIGYPELADRLAVIRDGLEPAVIEALKYYFYRKAGETCPHQKTGVRYWRRNAGGLEFHLYGLRQDSTAVATVPPAVYEKALDQFKRRPRGEPFRSLRFRSYLSAQNMMPSEGIL